MYLRRDLYVTFAVATPFTTSIVTPTYSPAQTNQWPYQLISEDNFFVNLYRNLYHDL